MATRLATRLPTRLAHSRLNSSEILCPVNHLSRVDRRNAVRNAVIVLPLAVNLVHYQIYGVPGVFSPRLLGVLYIMRV